MFVAPPPSTGLRWAAYAATLTLVGLFAFQTLSAPKTPYQEIRARVDTGWNGTYFDETPFPVEAWTDGASESAASGDALARIRFHSLHGGCPREAWKPFGVLSTALLSFLVLGIAGWLGAVLANARPFRRRRAAPNHA